jgi:acyl dehydratase
MRAIDYNDLPRLAGEEIGVSDWIEVTQERVDKFADATGDHQWIHVDVARAKREMGGTIAHGYLTLSLIPMLGASLVQVDGVSRAINYGSDRVRFLNMLRVGKRVRLRLKIVTAEHRAHGTVVKFESTVEIEGETKPACVAENISVYSGA